MKKSFLLLMAGLAAGIANGQVARQSIMFGGTATTSAPAAMQHLPLTTSGSVSTPVSNTNTITNPVHTPKGAKTTVTMDRWYDYVLDLLQPYEQNVAGADINYYSPDMWNDTNAIYGYTGTTTPYYNNSLVSIGASVDPTFSPWNATGSSAIITDFTGAMAVTPSDALTLDSLWLPGWYNSAPGKAGVVDTLVVAIVVSNGSAGADLSPASLTGTVVTSYCPTCTALSYYDMWHHIAQNVAAHNGGTTPATYIYKFSLAVSDTNASAYKNSIFPRTYLGNAVGTTARSGGLVDPVINVPVPAGNFVGASVTFKTGDPAYPSIGDTIRYSDGTAITGEAYNHYQTQVFYAAATSTSTTPLWNWYDIGNRGGGYFEFAARGWGAPVNKYYPNWDIITGSSTAPSPASAQNPHVAFHFKCTSCSALPIGSLNVNNVKLSNITATPNPANNQLTISYTGTAATTVSLTNVVGQVMAMQTVNNGKAIFNTSALPAGMYVYSLKSESGETATGRIVVAH